MKLEKEFESKDNCLYKLDGTKIPVETAAVYDAASCIPGAPSQDFCRINLPWTLVGLDEESYNEEFLAQFRDWLKELEEKSQYAYINPVTDSATDTDEQKECLVQSMKHCARRIKDCKSVVGFAVPSECDAAYFMEELSAKHKHYVFFSGDKSLLADGSIVDCN